jgi:hypothetical protein
LCEQCVFVVELFSEVGYACFYAVDAVESAFEYVDGVLDDFGEGAHGGLSATVGLCLSPDIVDDLWVKIAFQLATGLLGEYVG